MKNKILLVDDERIIRYLLNSTLSDWGFAVTEAEDGLKAQEKLESNEFDVVLLDYMMPGKSGLEVCQWLRATNSKNRDIPVMLLTAKSSDQDKEAAVKAGVSSFMGKPFDPMDILMEVQRLLAKGEDSNE